MWIFIFIKQLHEDLIQINKWGNAILNFVFEYIIVLKVKK